MIRGYINFKESKIPFAVEDYCMELFSDDEKLLDDFTKEYRFREDYILQGECFYVGNITRNATFLVERSMGSTCYLRCYIIGMFAEKDEFDAIGFQAPSFDDIFKYRYNRLNLVKEGCNLDIEAKDIYKMQFNMNDKKYYLKYRIGRDVRLGLLEDLERKGEILVCDILGEIQECHSITVVLHRLAMFMTSHNEVPFKQIVLYKNGLKAGWFYCPLVLGDIASGAGTSYFEFDVEKYIPKILNNIAQDPGNKITKSIPLGHFGNFDMMFSPQRFMEQVMAFEYLFDKLHHKKAKNKGITLKEELKYMFDEFPQALVGFDLSADDAGEQIKKLRHSIAHGHAYYYDFKNDYKNKRLMLLLDVLIKKLSLLWIGFSKEEIEEYSVC